MNTTSPLKLEKAKNSQRNAIVALLSAEQLPVNDLPASMENFFVATAGDKIIGVIGLEVYGDYGLLRSMVVDQAHRNNHIASHLVNRLESFAQSLGLQRMYLLTQTAESYFDRKGYRVIGRKDIPEAIKASSEFSHTCPATAVAMQKEISGK